VFLSSEALKEQLYLAQSPNRPRERPYEHFADSADTQVRIKPLQSLLELETAEPANHTNYDTLSATAPMRGPEGAVEPFKEQDEAVIRRTLHSKLVPSHQRMQFAPPNYAIGSVRQGLHGKELHLSPIHEVIALRPSFTHHKAKDDPSKAADKGGAKDKKDDGKGIHQITTKIKKKESERQTEWRVNSLDEVRRQEKQEQWTDLEWFPQGAPETIELMEKLHYTGSWNEVSFEVGTDKYIEFMIKGGVQMSEEDRKAEREALESAAASTADHWIKQTLRAAGTMYWWRLQGLAQEAKQDEELIKEVLYRDAVLVRGCWCLKSHLQYDGELEKQDARDAVLLAFREKRHFTRDELHGVTKQLQPNALKEIIAQLGVRRAAQVWEYKLVDDDSFTSTLYTPQLKQKHELFWQDRRNALEQISVQLQGNETNKGAYTVLQDWLIKTLDTETMFTLEELKLAREQQQADDPQFDTAIQDVTDRDFAQVLAKVAVDIRGVFVPRTAPPSLCKPTDIKMKYWPVLVELFGEMETVRRDDAKKKVKMLLGESDVPPAAWSKFMKRLANNLRANWTFKGKAKNNGAAAER